MSTNKINPEVNSKNTNDDYYSALIKQKEFEIQQLQSKVDHLQSEKDSILRSVSFKLGQMMTAPVRLLISLFKNSKKKAHNPIKASCDTAIFSNGFIEISGWALSDSLIEKVLIFIHEERITHARLGLFRKDVLAAIPNNPESEFSGFVAHFKHPSLPSRIKLEIHDSEGNIVCLEKVVLPATDNMQFDEQYQILLQQQEPIRQQLLNELLNKKFEYQPIITVLILIEEQNNDRINSCIKSVIKQDYKNWQLCLICNKSDNKGLNDLFAKWQQQDNRIISYHSNINATVEKSTGDYIAFLPASNEFNHGAFLQIVNELNQNETDVIYFDEDIIDADGKRCNPHFKPDFNLDALLSWNYLGACGLINRKAGEAVGWFSENINQVNIYELYLKLADKNFAFNHIPQVLSHNTNVDNAINSDKQTLYNHLMRTDPDAELIDGFFNNCFRVKRKILQQNHVSIIVPFKDQVDLLKTCVESLLKKTDYSNFSLLLINNQSEEKPTLDYCNQLVEQHKNIELYDFNEPFNFARLNNWAVKKTSSEYVLLLNNDTEVINPDWLCAMVEHIQRPEVAAVGAKLLFPDNTIQHAGVVVSPEGAVHNNRFLADEAYGYFNRTNYIQNVSACTAACLLLKKSVFLQVGGFDETKFAIAYNDVDLCLKIRQAGYLITYTPYAKLYHYESQSRGQDNSPEKLSRFTKELKNYQQKWAEIYKNGDPYLNPNLARAAEKITLNIEQ